MYALQIVPCMHSYLYRKLSKIVSTLWLCKAAYMHVCIYTTLYIIVWYKRIVYNWVLTTWHFKNTHVNCRATSFKILRKSGRKS